LSLFLAVGIGEECVLRGYLLSNLAQGLNGTPVGSQAAIWVAWAVSSAIFGLLHQANPNATLWSSTCLAVAGLMLGLGYVLTGELAISIGLHISWNLFLGTLLGFPVSGITFPGGTLIAVTQGGPTLWTGGRFGPEAGLVGLAAYAAGCLAILAWVKRSRGGVRLSSSIAQGPRVRQDPDVSVGASVVRQGEARE
jgi:hypothetical protein